MIFISNVVNVLDCLQMKLRMRKTNVDRLWKFQIRKSNWNNVNQVIANNNKNLDTPVSYYSEEDGINNNSSKQWNIDSKYVIGMKIRHMNETTNQHEWITETDYVPSRIWPNELTNTQKRHSKLQLCVRVCLCGLMSAFV